MLERVVRGEATPMDLDIISLGPAEHHRPLPLRARRLDGDAGRAMVRKFRPEFEAVIETAGLDPHAVVAAPPETWGPRYERARR
jgi:hypothetical protein